MYARVAEFPQRASTVESRGAAGAAGAGNDAHRSWSSHPTVKCIGSIGFQHIVLALVCMVIFCMALPVWMSYRVTDRSFERQPSTLCCACGEQRWHPHAPSVCQLPLGFLQALVPQLSWPVGTRWATLELIRTRYGPSVSINIPLTLHPHLPPAPPPSPSPSTHSPSLTRACTTSIGSNATLRNVDHRVEPHASD